jgi:hypothetical protein
MTPRHTLALFAGIGSVVILVACLVKILPALAGHEIPKSFSVGERFSVAHMRPGDNIKITKNFYPDRGEAYSREYAIRGSEPLEFAAIAQTVDWVSGRFRTTPREVIASFTLTPDETEGVDLALGYLIKVSERPSTYGTARYEYRVLYYRGDMRVGETFVADASLLSELGYNDAERRRGNAVPRDLERLAMDEGLPYEDVVRMKSFEMLEHEAFRESPLLRANRATSEEKPR